VPGYVTPKTAVGAVVGNEAGEILLVQRAGTGVWLYPTGWADIGYSPSEVAMKEVEEETGIQVEPVALMAVFDGMRLGFHSIPLYSLIFHCRMIGGALKPHPLECLDVGFFARDNLPEPLAGSGLWVDMAFAAIEGRQEKTFFDLPRDPTWRTRPDDEH
jgi:ADP-ribose pyrophosphatase YjhB (NUDIX family)